MEPKLESTKEVNPKYIKGLKGWLLFFVLSLLYIGVNLSFAIVKRIIANPNLFALRIEIQMINFGLMFIGVFFPFYIAYSLYKKNTQVLLMAKIFLVLLPFYAFTWNIFRSEVFPFDIEHAIISGLFIGACLYSIPWLFYLNYSKRVSNTYLFTGKYLPKDVQCPYCLELIELEKDKQLIQDFECASCSRIISRNNL